MKTANTSEPKLTQTLLDDVRNSDFKRTLRRDWSELKEFYLDEIRKERLQQMGKVKRFFVAGWWLIKSLLLKLTPARRLMLALSLIFLLSSHTISIDEGNVHVSNDTKMLGFVLVLFVLMLELKDKLLAQSELEAGRSVQRALLPKTNPQITGWELWLTTIPANEVGGDLVDYLELGPNRFGVALGDVAGKGLKAALLMVKLQATLRALAADFHSLADLGKKLNAILRRDGLPESFISLVYLELSSDSPRVRWLNAGHMPPLLLRNYKLTELPQGAAALGVLAEPAFVEQQIELQPNETLLLYSDGLIEARNEAGEFFGEQRLANFLPTLTGLSATEIGVRVISEVERFVGEARPHDDLSLVVLKRASA
jgi:hypothetical protein